MEVSDPPLSKSAVNRAGETLTAAHRAGAELPVEPCEGVAKWRELHAEPLAWLTMSLRGRVEMPASYRLKRLPQIVAKLARAGTMKLAQMQDIGGCRIVVDCQDDVDSAAESIERRSAPSYEVVRITDYRRDGRQITGYRALHIIVRRDECLLEIQVRTRRQHAWAEAVERAANRTKHRLKDGEGPAALVEYFRHASECLAVLDDGNRLPAQALAEFQSNEAAIAEYFPLVSDRSPSTFEVKGKSLATRENNWLLVYNWRDGKPVHWMDCGTDVLSAARTYSEWELRYPWRDGYEVVLIGSDSLETIEWTHAHYFGRSPDDIDPHGVLEEVRTA